MSGSPIQIVKEDGVIQIEPWDANGSLKVSISPNRSNLYIPRKSCRTKFSTEVIEYLAQRWNFAWFCDSLSRYDDSDSVSMAIKNQMFSYFPAERFIGRSLLDFGCGAGASTFAIAKMLPKTEIVGVDLDINRIETANRINSFLNIPNLRFLCSPSGVELPQDAKDFDFVMLSAVYEHLLPHERKTVMPLIWSVMRPGAAIFINQTPYRYSPYEAHSTGLWLVNYMPDRVAHFMARHLVRRNQRIKQSTDWNVQLRGGLRGATEKEIVRNLTEGDTASARILQPRQNGLRDRADFWLSSTNQTRYRILKKCISSAFRITDRLWGTIPRLNLEVVIQKPD